MSGSSFVVREEFVLKDRPTIAPRSFCERIGYAPATTCVHSVKAYANFFTLTVLCSRTFVQERRKFCARVTLCGRCPKFKTFWGRRAPPLKSSH